MANNRVNIRAALKNLLLNNTSAGANVYTNRKTNLWSTELPAICLSTEQEPATLRSQQAKDYIRTLEMKVEAIVVASATVDDTLDAMLASIENIVLSDISIQGTVLSTTLTNTEIKVDSDGQQDVATGTLTLQCEYVG